MEHFSDYSKIYSLITEFTEPSPLAVTATDKRTGQMHRSPNSRVRMFFYPLCSQQDDSGKKFTK